MPDVRLATGLPEDDWDEPRWQRWVVATARANGWTVRVMDQRNRRGVLHAQSEDQRGWPDLLLVDDRVVWVELKPKGGKLSAMQRDKIDRLVDAGAEVHIMEPSHWGELLALL